MTASVNRYKPKRTPTGSRNSSRKSSIVNSARSPKPAGNDEFAKLLSDKPASPIAAHHHKPEVKHFAPASPVPKKDSAPTSPKKTPVKGEPGKDLKKVKKPAGKGFFGGLFLKVKSLFT